jgi:ABC-type transporter Mla MlaB component
MELYQHDSPTLFRFVLRGDLAGDRVQNLEHAWATAKSILDRKELVVDVSGITDADTFGMDLLSRMRESGARLTAALRPESEELLRTLGLPVPAPGGWFVKARVLRILRSVGVLR